MTLLEAIARDLRRPEEQLRLPADLLRQGYDPSYLARVRPDELNQLDAATLARLRRALRYRDNLEKIKEDVRKDGEEQGWWSESISTAVSAAGSAAEVQALTRNIRSRRSSTAIATADPNAAKVATEILMASGPAPTDFNAWIKQQVEIDDAQIEPMLANVNAYLQALLLEDSGLIAKIFGLVKNRAVVQSSLIETPADASGGDGGGEGASANKRKRKKRKRSDKPTGESTDQTSQNSQSETASQQPSAESVPSESQPQPSNQVEPAAESVQPTNAIVSQAGPSDDADDAQSKQEQQSSGEEPVVPEESQVDSAEHAAAANEVDVVDAGAATSETTEGEAGVTDDAKPADAGEIRGFDENRKTKTTRAVSAKELSPRQRRRRWLKIQLEPYSKLRRALTKLSPYQIVMLGRGNRSQILKVELDYDRKAVSRMARESLGNREHPFAEFLDNAVDEAMNGLLANRIEQEVFADAEEHAQQQLIEYSVEHLQTLLMQRPVRGHRILMIDAIGTKSAAVVIVDPEGKIDHIGELPCNSMRPDAVNQNVRLLGEWAHDYNVSLIALSTGPARRYLMHSIREFMSQSDPDTIRWTMVDREGADTYCTTRLALQELPTLSRRHRAAAWLAWRMQDPLVQLLKVEPTRLRLAVFQAELPPTLVEESLQEAVASSVATRGIDYWNGHQKALACVPGLDDQLARTVCEIRDSEGPASREALLLALAEKLPPNKLRQAIGFLRVFGSEQSLDGTLIHPDDYRLAERLIENSELGQPPATPEGWTKSARLPENVSAAVADEVDSAEVTIAPANENFGDGVSEEPASALETDSGDAAAAELPSEVAEESNSTPDVTADTESQQADTQESPSADPTADDQVTETEVVANDTIVASENIEASVSGVAQPSTPKAKEVKTFGGHPLAPISRDFSTESKEATKLSVDVEKLARGWQVGREKLKFVAQVLQHPFDDPRELSAAIPLMRRVPKIDELQRGETLWAIVSGIADFGVFADLGPDCSGLIHVSRLSRNYVEDPHQVVNVGDLVQVWVVDVDAEKRRISLSALPPGVAQESRPYSDGGERGEYRGGGRGGPRQDNRGGNARPDYRSAPQDSSSRPAGRGGPQGAGSGRGAPQSAGSAGRGAPQGARSGGGRDRNAPSGAPAGSGGGSRPDRGGGGRPDRRDSRGRGNDRNQRRGGAPNIGAATVIDLPSKELPASARKGNSASSEPASGNEPMRSFGDLLARFQTKHEEAKQAPVFEKPTSSGSTEGTSENES